MLPCSHFDTLLLPFLFLFLIAIWATGEQVLSFWTQNFTSSLPNPKLIMKIIPRKNPKNQSLMALFPRHNRMEETPTRQNNNDLRNRSNSETLHDHKPATQVNTNTSDTNFFPFLFLLMVNFPLQPPTRRFRIRYSGRSPLESPRAISPTRELKGSGKILRLNATVEASWSIFRFDDWDQPCLLAHMIGWCERRNEIELWRRELMLILEAGKGRRGSEIEGRHWVLQV